MYNQFTALVNREVIKMKKTARAIIIENDKLLVFYRRKVIDGKIFIYYAIPGGHVDLGESNEECVIRELKEEMNLDIEVLNYVGKITIDDCEENYYYCKIVGGKLRFGGEELERCNIDNYYEIMWLSLLELDNVNIRAIDLVRKVLVQDDGFIY